MVKFFSKRVRGFANRLFRQLWLVAAVTVVLLTIMSVSFSALSSMRASVYGESLWSKAQKDAVSHLRHYIGEGDEASYRQFLDKASISTGDRVARIELDRPNPNLAVARAGFRAGGNHVDDIDGMIWLYQNFKHAPYVEHAIKMWAQGDLLMNQLIVLGADYHKARGEASPQVRAGWNKALTGLDSSFTQAEEEFSTSLGMASRLTLKILSALNFTSVAVCFLILTSIFFRRLSAQRGISRRELALSEERVRLGFQGTNCGLWDWNIVTNEVSYSPWITELLEYGDQPATVREHIFISIVHSEDRAAILAAGTAHIVYNVPYDVEYRIKNLTGKYLWVRSRAQAVRDAHGKAIRMTGSIFDISELKAAEQQFFIQRELAQVTLAAIADAVIRIDVDGCINYCNVIAEDLLGRTFQSFRGQSFSVIFRVFDDSQQSVPIDLVSRVLSGQTKIYENANLHLKRNDGGLTAIDVSVASVSDQAGNFFGAVVVMHDVSAEREHASQLQYQASHDELTGLINRREFERQLCTMLALAPTVRTRHALMYLDLDQLKIVNDSGGHPAGDQLIRQASALLQHRLRDGDLLGRLGGDEFGIIVKNCNAEDAVRVAESLRKMIFESRFVWEGKSYSTGISIGLVTDIEQFACLKDLVKVADAACFMAKEKGRNRVQLYRPDDQELSMRHREIEWVARIDQALDKNHFCLYAQRIVPAGADDPLSQHVELLLRMLDADGKVIMPMSFIPAAERYNLMPKIDRWVIAAAFDMLVDNFARGVNADVVTCAINISGASIEDEQFLDFILAEQRRTGVPFSAICFEITETTAIGNLPKAAQFISSLRSLGCSFSLDDFGSGMASFGYLKHLPVDFLKIDGSFVKDMINDPIDRAMVEAINQIGHVMNKKTIAEFVENDAIFNALKRMGVDYAQGYAIGKPAPFHAEFLLSPPALQDPVLLQNHGLDYPQVDYQDILPSRVRHRESVTNEHIKVD